MRPRALLFLLVAGPALAAPPAPPPPLAEAHGDLDGDGRPERLILDRSAELRIEDAGGRSRGQLALSAKPEKIVRARIEVVTVQGHPVAHVIAAQGGGRATQAVVTLDGAGMHVLFNGPTGSVGDGERSIELQLEPGGMTRWQTSPTLSRCDGEDRLFFERWDWASQKFQPAELAPPDGTPLPVTTTPPPGLAHRPLGIFHFIAESTDPSAAGERRADFLAAPHELEDGTLRTSWVAGAPGEGRGAWVAARTADAQHRVTALRIAPGPGPAPPKLTLLVGKSRWSVAWPKEGGPIYAVLPEPEPADCVAVVIAEAPDKAHSPGTALSEIAIYTDADGTGGLDALAAEVGRGGEGADGAAQVLASHGNQATQVIASALTTATGAGRRHLIEVLGGLGDPAAAPALGHALETAAESERAPLISGLSRLGAAGATEAARIFTANEQAEGARADAAEILGAIAGAGADGQEAAIRALVDGAGRGDQAVRAAAQQALAEAGARNPAVTRAIIAAIPSGGTAERSGDLARALGTAARRAKEPLRTEAQAQLVSAWPKAESFALKLRLLRAVGDLGSPAGGASALISKVARQDPDEVLRFTAVEAASALDGESGRAILRASVSDRDPRVRRTALGGLAAHPDGETAALFTSALGHDAWPIVRAASAEGMATSCAAPGIPAALARAAVGTGEELRGADRSEPVRRAALGSLGHCAPRDPAIARALESAAEPASVRELAAALVAKSGDPAAGRTLAGALISVLSDPASDERSAGLAVSITRALGRTGDRSRPVLEALGAASNEPMVPAIRAAAMESIGQLCPEGAGPALERGAADKDGTVRRAAAQALRRCHR
ncbi:MAG TPA: HEAT repeat domain-containing protein [Polyangia bacterium]